MARLAHSDDNFLDGQDACGAGQTMWENPNPEGTFAHQQWKAGWMAADFDDRADEQFQLMETSHGENTAPH